MELEDLKKEITSIRYKNQQLIYIWENGISVNPNLGRLTSEFNHRLSWEKKWVNHFIEINSTFLENYLKNKIPEIINYMQLTEK